jgi:glycosyltransferase involved in cell wall biosynthesis
VLTAMPNYPRGKIYEGYGGLFRREERDGVRVLRCWLYPHQGLGVAGRLLNYLSFVATSLVLGALFLPRVDYLLTESPPLFLGISGYLLSRLKRARWIFNVSDLWPESAVHLGILRPGWALSASGRLEAFCYRHAWLVTGQSREILESIRSRFPSVRTYHLSNGVDAKDFHPRRRSDEARRDLLGLAGASEPACVAVYAGLHGLAQGLDQILAAAARLRHRPEIRILLVGEGPTKRELQEMARDLRLEGVKFVDSLPRERVPAVLACADAAIVPLKTQLPGAVPSKIYEAMGSGIPIVLVADGEPAEIVRSSGAGITVSPNDVPNLAAALEQLSQSASLRTRLGAAGRQAAETLFDRGRIAEAFVRYLGGNAC